MCPHEATFSLMTTVGLRKLKSQLSEYVRRAAEGELVLVTDRGRVVAELRAPENTPERLLQQAVARGSVRLGLGNHRPEIYDIPSPAAELPEGIVATLLDEQRGER